MIPYIASTAESVYSIRQPLVSSSGLTVAEAEAAMRKEARHSDTTLRDFVLFEQNVKANWLIRTYILFAQASSYINRYIRTLRAGH